MSRYVGWHAERPIQARAGFVSLAALLCLSAPMELAAQPTTPEGQTPAPEQTPNTQPASAAQPGTTNIRPVTVEANRRRPRPVQNAPTRRARAPLPSPTQRAPPPSVWTGALQ